MSMPLITGVGKQDTLPSCHRNSFFLSHVHSEGAHRCKLGFARLCISRTKLSEQPQQFFVFMIRPLTQHTLLQSLCIHLSHINSSLCSSVTLTRKASSSFSFLLSCALLISVSPFYIYPLLFYLQYILYFSPLHSLPFSPSHSPTPLLSHHFPPALVRALWIIFCYVSAAYPPWTIPRFLFNFIYNRV